MTYRGENTSYCWLSTFSNIRNKHKGERKEGRIFCTYRNTVGILLSDAFSLGLTLLKGVFVLKLAVESRQELEVSLLHV